MEKSDRRVRRTQQALSAALIELITEKDFELISVAEIAERADVGRSTFYSHYADKDDLLKGSIEGLRAHLLSRMQDPPSSPAGHPVLAFCLPMLEHVEDANEVFVAMARMRGHIVHELIQDMFADFARSRAPELDALQVQVLVGAFSAAILWWRSDAPHLSPAEVHARFRAFVEPCLPIL